MNQLHLIGLVFEVKMGLLGHHGMSSIAHDYKLATWVDPAVKPTTAEQRPLHSRLDHADDFD